MKRSDLTGQRLVAIVLMGCVLLNYPILSLFSRPLEVAGLPLRYAYIFATWTLLVGLMAWVVERPRD